MQYLFSILLENFYLAASGCALLPAHGIADGIGDVADGFERAADRALHGVLLGTHRDHGRAADDQPHTHTDIEISFIHFLHLHNQVSILCAQNTLIHRGKLW